MAVPSSSCGVNTPGVIAFIGSLNVGWPSHGPGGPMSSVNFSLVNASDPSNTPPFSYRSSYL